jgi:hypothetical protein
VTNGSGVSIYRLHQTLATHRSGYARSIDYFTQKQCLRASVAGDRITVIYVEGGLDNPTLVKELYTYTV